MRESRGDLEGARADLMRVLDLATDPEQARLRRVTLARLGKHEHAQRALRVTVTALSASEELAELRSVAAEEMLRLIPPGARVMSRSGTNRAAAAVPSRKRSQLRQHGGLGTLEKLS